MEKINLKDIRGRKTGTNYLILTLPKEVLKNIPDPCYLDIEIKEIRSGVSDKPTKIRRKR